MYIWTGHNTKDERERREVKPSSFDIVLLNGKAYIIENLGMAWYYYYYYYHWKSFFFPFSLFIKPNWWRTHSYSHYIKWYTLPKFTHTVGPSLARPWACPTQRNTAFDDVRPSTIKRLKAYPEGIGSNKKKDMPLQYRISRCECLTFNLIPLWEFHPLWFMAFPPLAILRGTSWFEHFKLCKEVTANFRHYFAPRMPPFGSTIHYGRVEEVEVLRRQ